MELISALIVEDNPDDRRLVERVLARHFGIWPLTYWVTNAAQLTAALQFPWQVAICDYVLPGLEWPRALNMIRTVYPDCVFIVMSGKIDTDRGILAIKEGADDYLDKSLLGELGGKVENWLALRRVARRHADLAEDVAARLRQIGEGHGTK